MNNIKIIPNKCSFCDKEFFSKSTFTIHENFCLLQKKAIETNHKNSHLKRKIITPYHPHPPQQLQNKEGEGNPINLEQRIENLERDVNELKTENAKLKILLNYRIRKNILETLNKCKLLPLDCVFSIWFKNIEFPENIIEKMRTETIITLLQNIIIYNCEELQKQIPIISVVQKKKTLYFYDFAEEKATPIWKIMPMETLNIFLQQIGTQLMMRFQEWNTQICFENLSTQEQEIHKNMIINLNGCNGKDSKRNSAIQNWLCSYLEENIELISGWD